MSALLEVRDFVVSDDRTFSVTLPELQLAPGSVTALFGPSGCGKTSLLLGMFDLLERPGWQTEGRVTFRERQLSELNRDAMRALRRGQLAYLMQDAHNALDPLVPVGQQIADATDASRDGILVMLQKLGVDDAASLMLRQPHRISGGQAQRVLLAIAFLRRPTLVIADEPSSSLDGGSYSELLSRLRELVENDCALLMATHDHRLLQDLQADVYELQGDKFLRSSPLAEPWPKRSAAKIGTVPLLGAEDVRVASGERAVLDGVDFELRRGEIVALLGESGAGKTTLLRVLAGHRRPDAGKVVTPDRVGSVQLVCQDSFASLTPGRRLQSLLDEASAPYFDAQAGANSVQLSEEVLTRTAAAMSGGERRRAALLRALAVQPDVLLLDEPTASLDRESAVAVIDNLLTMQRSRALALLVATHDDGLADAIAHRRIELRGGKLCEL